LDSVIPTPEELEKTNGTSVIVSIYHKSEDGIHGENLSITYPATKEPENIVMTIPYQPKRIGNSKINTIFEEHLIQPVHKTNKINEKSSKVYQVSIFT